MKEKVYGNGVKTSEGVPQDILISVDKLSFSHGSDELLKDVSFTIHCGDKVGLIGPNGAGKTTLLKIIQDDLFPDEGYVRLHKGVNIGFMPQSVNDMDMPRIGDIGSFVKSGKGLLELERRLSELESQMQADDGNGQALEKYGKVQTLYENKGGFVSAHEIRRLTDGLGLNEFDLSTSISRLSGGQKTRLFLARILFSNPSLLLLDEPTNHLDAPILKWLVEYLNGYDGGIIVVSHDKRFLDDVANRIFKLNGSTGKIEKYSGNYSQAARLMEEREKSLEKRRREQQKEIRRLQSTINLWRRRGKRASKAAQLTDRVNRIKGELPDLPHTQKPPSFKLEVKERSHEHVLHIENLSKSYGGKNLLENIQLDVLRGEKLVILGPNGTGKSTLIKLIMGIIKPDSGSICIGSKVDMGYYAQEHEGLSFDNTVMEEAKSADPSAQENKIKAILGKLGLKGRALERKVSTLSPGERAKLALSKLILLGVNTLILDEPTNHLDAPSKKSLCEVLAQYQGTIIVTSHDSNLLGLLEPDKVITIPNGEVIQKGNIP